MFRGIGNGPRAVDFTEPDILKLKPNKQRLCSIIATITDTQITPVDLQKLMEAGMNVARLKMSNYSKNDKIRLLGKVDKAAAACCRKYGVANWPVATCIELKTCIIKTGILEEDVPYIVLEDKTEVILTCNVAFFNKCNQHEIFIDNPALTVDVAVGKEISVCGDEIILKCTEIVDDKSVKCVVKKGGKLFNVCNVSIRGITHSRPVITKRDLHLIRFAVEYQVDIIIINYVRNVDNIRKVKEFIGKNVKKPIILSGICTEQALNSIDGILKESDGIILSREFLPYELEASKKYRLNNIQKWLAGKCQKAGKPLFLSGGVFQNVLSVGTYRDCEMAEVANAVLDGITGFVLRDCENIETLLESIRFLDEACCEIEPYTCNYSTLWDLADQMATPLNAAEATVVSCAAMALQTGAKVIVLPTVTGRTAKALLGMMPSCLILAVCTNAHVTRLLRLYRCMVPLLYSGKPHKRWHHTVEARIEFAIEFAVRRGWLLYGDTFITLQRGSEDISFCDMIRIRNVTISKKPLVECSDDEHDDDDEKKFK